MVKSYINDEFFGRLETLALHLRASLAGFFGGVPRLPLQPATDTAIADIRAQIEKLGLLGKYK